MDINANIRLKSKMSGDDDIIELATEGSFHYKNGSWYIFYEEKEEMGMTDCSVMVKVSEGEATVTRKGDFSSKMVYKKGKTTEFIYHMPYGTMPILLDTKDVKFSFDDDGGELELRYVLSVNDGESENVLNLTITKNKDF